MTSKGILRASTFSWGCKRAKMLGISEALKEFAGTHGKMRAEADIREALKNLYSYVYYLVIAESNRLSPFDLKVVDAHWIGNDYTEKIDSKAVRRVFNQMKKSHDDKILAWAMMPLSKEGSAHHNAYARHNPKCSVVCRKGWLYHLGKKRIKATPEIKQSLNQYGRGV